MDDVGRASDSAYVTVVKNAELENHPEEVMLESQSEGTGVPMVEQKMELGETGTLEVSEMEALAFRVVRSMQEMHQGGESFVAIAVNPSIIEEFTAAFKGLPDEVVSAEIKEKLPIIPEDSVSPLRIITQTDLEVQYFQQRYGPREIGGNGLLQDLEAALLRERSPVRITPEFLRVYYLMELAERVKPRLYSPSGADVFQSVSHNLRR